MTGKMSD